jgi:hypothetical protein
MSKEFDTMYIDHLVDRDYPPMSMDGMQLAAADTGRLPEVVVTGEPEAPTSAGGPAGKPEPRFGRGGVTKARSEAAGGIEVPAMGLADTLAGALRGTVAQSLGLPGDIESLVRLLTGGEQVLPTTEDISEKGVRIPFTDTKVTLPPVVPENAPDMVGYSAAERRKTADVAGKLGEYNPILGAPEAVKIGVKGAKAAGAALAPAAGELFSNYAKRTGLVQYVADPNRVFANYSGEYIQPTRRLKTLVDKLESGTISEQSFIEETKTLSSQMKERAAKVTSEDKVRGADEVTRRLLGALNPNAQIQLKEETVRFAKWLLDNNPQFANDLGISIKSGGVKGTAGGYTSLDMVATIFADKANPGTGVHEILHHTEQMMPVAVQNGILDEWTKAYLNAYRTADPKVQAYLKQIPDAISGKPLAKNLIMEGFKRGVLDYDTHYQLVNPSEYWAVNATRIMNSRYEAGSWVGKAKVWLNEFAEKAKGAFGLPSDSPVLKGIKDITKGSGQLQSEMLTEPENVSSSAARVKVQKKKTEQRKQVAKGAAVTGAGLSLTGDEE